MPAAWQLPANARRADYPFVLITGAILEHWHTGSMTRRSAVLDELAPHPVAHLSREQMQRLGCTDGQVLRLRAPGAGASPGTKTAKSHARWSRVLPLPRSGPPTCFTHAALDHPKFPKSARCAWSCCDSTNFGVTSTSRPGLDVSVLMRRERLHGNPGKTGAGACTTCCQPAPTLKMAWWLEVLPRTRPPAGAHTQRRAVAAHGLARRAVPHDAQGYVLNATSPRRAGLCCGVCKSCLHWSA